MNPRDTSGCRQNPSPITKSRRLEESKSRSPFFRSLLDNFDFNKKMNRGTRMQPEPFPNHKITET
jgi:hypothetical protein